MNPYPQNLNYNNGQNTNNSRSSYQMSKIDPNVYAAGPATTANNQNYGQTYSPAANTAINSSTYNEPQYGYTYDGRPATGFNDPSHEHYEIYNSGYSRRQKCIIFTIIVFLGLIIAGFILFFTRNLSSSRYPYY